MDQQTAEAGDRLQQIIQMATQALMAGNQDALWQVLDVHAFDACREWDRLRGRPAPTDEEVERGTQALIRQLKS